MTTSANLIKGISERISDFNRAVPGSAKISDIIDGCIDVKYIGKNGAKFFARINKEDNQNLKKLQDTLRSVKLKFPKKIGSRAGGPHHLIQNVCAAGCLAGHDEKSHLINPEKLASFVNGGSA